MKPERINWKVAAVIGATTSMVGAGGFALADGLSETNDSGPTTTTNQSVSIEPARLSSPVVVDQVVDESVESAPSAESVVEDTPTDLTESQLSVESIPSAESAESAVPAEPVVVEAEPNVIPDSVESAASVSVESAASVSVDSVAVQADTTATPDSVESAALVSVDSVAVQADTTGIPDSVESAPSVESAVSVASSD